MTPHSEDEEFSEEEERDAWRRKRRDNTLGGQGKVHPEEVEKCTRMSNRSVSGAVDCGEVITSRPMGAGSAKTACEA